MGAKSKMEEKNKNEIELSPEETEKEEQKKTKKVGPKGSTILTLALSLLASIVMWIVAVDYEAADYEKTFFNIEIEIKGKSELFSATQLQVTYDEALAVDVSVRGKRGKLSSLSSSSFKAYIDVSTIEKEGPSDLLNVEIEPINGVEIISQSLTGVSVKAERRIRKEMEIIPQLGIAQLEGGVEYKLLCDSQSVVITGSESVLNNITSVMAIVNPEPKNISASFKSRCEIVLQSEVEIDMESISISPSHCDVEVVLTKKKSVPLLPMIDGASGVEYNKSFTTEMKKIVICGEPLVIDEIDEIYYDVSYQQVLNLLGTGKKQFDIECDILYPESVSSIDNLEKVNVTVSEASAKIVVSGENIVLENCPKGFSASVGDVEISISGLYEEVNRIKVTDVLITVDLSQNDHLDGTYTGVVHISDANGIIYDKECIANVEYKVI